jgi:hypothetical protein
MDLDQIRGLLEEAGNRFVADDAYLLSVDANERSLTHKFAEHLQALVGKEWSVDCEYNRYGDDAKTLRNVKEIVGEYTSTDATKAKTVYPDVIVHKRGAQGPNLLVIEAKKDASKEEAAGDWSKLRRIQAEYKYSFAAFVNFETAAKKVGFEVSQ